MDFAHVFRTLSAAGNRVMVPLLRRGPLAGVLNKSMATVEYTGRKSGKPISLVIAYKRKGDVVTIAVLAPDAKRWWRNFTDDGAPMTLTLDGVRRPAHAVATRTERGGVTVRATLEAAPAQ